jgi:hypothetical protein
MRIERFTFGRRNAVHQQERNIHLEQTASGTLNAGGMTRNADCNEREHK